MHTCEAPICRGKIIRFLGVDIARGSEIYFQKPLSPSVSLSISLALSHTHTVAVVVMDMAKGLN